MTRGVLAAALLGAAVAHAQTDGGADSCSVEVQLDGLRDGGLVWVLLFSEAQAAAYPTKRDQALQRLDVAPRDGKASVVFAPVACGLYAVAVVHDENGNAKLDTNVIGIPKEGLGASRNARRMFGPPTFDDARVRVTNGRTTLPITVVY